MKINICRYLAREIFNLYQSNSFPTEYVRSAFVDVQYIDHTSVRDLASHDFNVKRSGLTYEILVEKLGNVLIEPKSEIVINNLGFAISMERTGFVIQIFSPSGVRKNINSHRLRN